MASYKHWSSEFRNKSYSLTTRAKKLGWIKAQDKCERCGQEEGIIHLHNEDYDVTYNTLREVFDRKPVSITEEEKTNVNAVLFVWCWRCHMMHHTMHRNPVKVKEYFAAVDAGKIFPPVLKHDFNILKVDHNV